MRSHILAFSSDRNMLHTLEFILEAEQFEVTTTSSWMDLYELLILSEHSIRLMILDTNGSGENSFDFLSDPEPRTRDIPIIVLGSPRGRRQKNDPKGSEISWMEKPVDRETLLRTITMLLRDKNTENNFKFGKF